VVGGVERTTVFPEASAEPDGQADCDFVRDPEVQPSDGACLFPSRGIPAALGIQQRVVSREVPGRVDGLSDAFAVGADEEDRPKYSESSAANPQLVPGPRTGLGGSR
jgi:hypothetical protein